MKTLLQVNTVDSYCIASWNMPWVDTVLTARPHELMMF